MSSAPKAMETAATSIDTALLVSITVLQGLTFLKVVSVLVKWLSYLSGTFWVLKSFCTLDSIQFSV